MPAYLKVNYAKDQVLSQIPTVFSIHNLGYQGIFEQRAMWLGGFDQSLFYSMSPFEYYGKMNFMKTGIVFSDIINTVSPKYAEEIQTKEFGYGLEGVLQSRVNDLYGILNGIDYEVWNPSTDMLISDRYTFHKIYGKRRCKNKLRKQIGLKYHAPTKVPLIAMISRLADQKGFDILAQVIEQILEMNVQFVILGTGDPKYHELFKGIQEKYPEKMAAILAFDSKLAHQIEAGADMFLMPSQYEPCGLNQMYSLKYGTVPIVRAIGGLADTIIDYDKNSEKSNGFTFREYSGEAILGAVKRAVELFKNQKVWKQLVKRGMECDFSWENSAKQYLELYNKAIQKHR